MRLVVERFCDVRPFGRWDAMMRGFLIILCLGGLGALGWHALTIGTDRPYLQGAPQIASALDIGEGDGAGDGTGDGDARAGTGKRRETRLAGMDGIGGGGAMAKAHLVDRVEEGPADGARQAPYTFAAGREADGTLVLTGYAPDLAAKRAIEAAARRLAGDAELRHDIRVAPGAPEGDWTGMVRTGLAALAATDTGRLEISGLDVTLRGASGDPVALEAAKAMVAAAPAGRWTTEITATVPEGGFVFRAMKTADGTIVVEGHAPDPATRDRLLATIETMAGQPVSGTLEIAAGMPDPGFPGRVERAVAALLVTEQGLVSVSAGGVRLTGDVETALERQALDRLVGDAWVTEVKVLDPTPLGDMTIRLEPDGSLSAEGRLPEGLDQAVLYAELPGIDTDGLDAETRGKAAEWRPAIEALAIVLPRMEIAEARLTGTALSLTGTMKRGFSARGAEAALSAALGRDWTVAVDVAERAPLAEIVLSKDRDGLSVSGLLPDGIGPSDALAILGREARGAGLTGGGDGAAEGWRDALAAVDEALELFRTASVRLAAGSVDLGGTLAPGYAADAADAWIAAKLPDGWRLALTAEETAPGEGDRRIDLATGATENFRRGYWLPDMDFPVSPARCAREVDGVLATRKITFLTGSAEISAEDAALLNRLAAIAVRCLNSSGLRLRIEGHTDSSGNDRINQRLSEERAAAVLEALAARGVRRDAMAAEGFGETKPIASNNTREGRARNRRITFGWSGDGG